jgi:tetratricopeptide (TPR) repeat protein
MNKAKSRWRINYRFAAWFFGGLALCAVCLYFWHGYQFEKSATVLLERARRQEEQSEWVPLVRTLRRYLQMSPEDDQAWQMLAKAEDRRADSFSGLVDATRVFGRVLARPGLANNVALRLRYARLLLDTGRYEDASTQADLAASQGSVQERATAGIVKSMAAFELAAADTDRANWDEVRASFIAAIATSPPAEDDLELCVRLAALYRDQKVKLSASPNTTTPPSQPERDELADQVIDELVLRHPDSAKAHLARYRYHVATGSELAQADLDAAIAKAGKDDIEVWIAAADAALATAQNQPAVLRKAIERYEAARVLAPMDRRVYVGLVRTYLLLEAAEPNGQSVATAEQIVKDALKQADDSDFELKLWQARIYLASGQDKKVDQALSELDAIRAGNQLAWSTSVRALAQVEVDRVRAEQSFARGEYAVAAEMLERLTRAEDGIAIEAGARQFEWIGSPYQTWISLGRSRDALKESDRAARAYERALTIAPNSDEARRSAARAWNAAGRPDLAAPHLASTAGDGSDADVIARLDQVISAIRSMREDERDWTDVRKQLNVLRESAATRFRACLLAAQVEMESRDTAAALAAVQAAEQTPATSPTEWRALVMAYQAVGSTANVERSLAEFAKLSTPVEVALVRSELFVGQQQFAAAEQALRDAKAGANEDQVAALELALAKMLLNQSRFAEAKTELDAVAKSKSMGRREAIRLLAGLQLETKDWAGLEASETLLSELDGPDSTQWQYFRASRLLQNPASDAAALAEAAELSMSIAKSRPDWLAAIQLQAEVAERQGQIDQAISAYERAVEISSGTEMEARLGSRLVELALQRPGELPKSLEETLAASPVLSSAAISRSVAEGRNDRALQIATTAAQLRPRDPVAHFWLGQTQLLSGQSDVAAASLLRAVEGGADFTLAWESLLNVLMASGKSTQATELVARLEASKSLPEPDRSLLLARAYALTGNARAAQKTYRDVASQFPQDVSVLRAAIVYFADRDIELAEKLARDAVTLSPSDGDSKRLLVGVLGARGSKASFDEARALLGVAGDGVPVEEADARLYAQLLSRRPELALRRQAVSILAGLSARKGVVPAQERLALAAQFESAGQHNEALRELIALNAQSRIVVPDHLAALAEYGIRHRDGASVEQVAAADKALTDLEEREPRSWRTVALRLRHNRLRDPAFAIDASLAAFTAEAVAAAATPETRASLLARSADLCSQLNEPALAEQYLRKAAAESTQGRRPLAMFLAGKIQSDATSEAIDLCLANDAVATSADDAATLCMVLTISGASDADYARAEPALRSALSKFPDDQGLQFAWGSLSLVRGQDDQADATLRKALELNPANSLAMNNLAYLRASQGKNAEALSLAERAIAVAGPANNFLDTLGLALLGDRRYVEAVGVFQDLAAVGKDPVTHLHLALAQHAQGDGAAAKAALAKAVELKLNRATLPAYDRRRLAELETALQN